MNLKNSKTVETPGGSDISVTEAISSGAVSTSHALDAKLIVCWTKTGRAPRMIRKYGPTIPIIALTDNDQTARQLALVRGVRAYVAKDWIKQMISSQKQEKLQLTMKKLTKVI